jgi:hypothetical protein
MRGDYFGEEVRLLTGNEEKAKGWLLVAGCRVAGLLVAGVLVAGYGLRGGSGSINLLIGPRTRSVSTFAGRPAS